MKKRKILLIILLVMIAILADRAEGFLSPEKLKIVFATDPHIYWLNIGAFDKAIELINGLNPDALIIGGDFVRGRKTPSLSAGALRSMWALYRQRRSRLNMPVYEVMGNHDIHEVYGKALYEENARKLPYSFDLKGWHFIMLDSVYLLKDEGYRKIKKSYYAWYVDESQLGWLKNDLKSVSGPVVVVTHVPLVTSYGAFFNISDINEVCVNNAGEVLRALKGHDVRLVLQGRLHLFEDISAGGIRFVTGGTVFRYWKEGRCLDTEDGFVVVELTDDSIDIKYVPTRWWVRESFDRLIAFIKGIFWRKAE